MLEAHESLPSDLTAPPTPTEKRPITSSSTSSTSTSTRRTHAEHHASFMPQTLRTTFALDIPSDATPSFQLSLGGGKPSSDGGAMGMGGLAWKVRLCLLVAMAAPDTQVRGMLRESPRGHWGSTWVPTDSLAPLERERRLLPPKPPSSPLPTSPTQTRSWASLFASVLGMSDGGEDGEGGGVHDGDEVLSEDEDDADEGGGEVDFGAGEEDEWREIAVETVECEIPVMVWPGNTAFRPEDVVFDV
jgi:RAB6A-GEF complex partner protein 2